MWHHSLGGRTTVLGIAKGPISNDAESFRETGCVQAAGGEVLGGSNWNRGTRVKP